MSKKTITIDSKYLSLNGKSNSQSEEVNLRKEQRRNHKASLSKMTRRSRNETSSLRKALMKKIKDHQHKQSNPILSKKLIANSTQDLKNKSIKSDISFDDEFNKSLSYLSNLAKKHSEKVEKKRIMNRNHAVIQSIKTQPIVSSNSDTLYSKPQSPINLTLKKPSIPVNSMPHNLTLKTNPIETPQIQLQMPDDLSSGIQEVSLSNLYTKHSSNPIDNVDNRSEIKIDSSNLNSTAVGGYNTIDAPYGVLKGGMKPTYREYYNKEYPLDNFDKVNNIENLDNKEEAIQASSIDKNLATIPIEFSNNSGSEKLGTINSINSENTKPKKAIRRTTIKRTVKKYKYNLGRDKKKRLVGLLIKNSDTRRKVNKELSQLNRVPIPEVKKYLRKHGLLKSGSSAPNDVLRKIYTQSVLAGDIFNVSKDTLLHNFYNT